MLAEKRSVSMSAIRLRRKVCSSAGQCQCHVRYKLVSVHCPLSSMERERERERERHPHKQGAMSSHMSDSTRNVSVGSESASALNTESCFCFVREKVAGLHITLAREE